MILEIILFVCIVFCVCLVVYKGAVHEFQILQKDWTSNMNWSDLLGEGVPLIVRNVAPEWKGAWTIKQTARKSWPIQVRDDEGLLGTTWSDWIRSAPGQAPLENTAELAQVAKLPIQTWVDGGFCRWSWLAPWRTDAFVLGPTSDTLLPAYKTVAICTLLQSTDGAPLQIWLAHEGAVPPQVCDDLHGSDPWSLRSEEVPWMEEVKYVEVKLRPGNAIAIPPHWWIAVRPMFSTTKPTCMGDGAWFWRAEFNSPVSYVIPNPKK
jgi:hypothetical protein